MTGPELLRLIEWDFGAYLYHGGPGGSPEQSEANLASFITDGIRGSTVYRETPTVYLTNSIWAASDYAQLDPNSYPGPVFRVAVRALDPALLRGDEWQLLPSPRYPAFNAVECDSQRGHEWTSKFPADGFAEAEDVIESLARSTQVAYLGSVAPELLEQVAGQWLAPTALAA